MEHRKVKRIFEDIVDEELSCWCFDIVNGLLKEAGINAKFETEQENTTLEKDGTLIRLTVK